MPPSDHAGMGLRGALSVLRRRKWVILLCVVVATSGAVALGLTRTEVYEATARILVEPAVSPFGSAPVAPVDSAMIETEIQVIESEPVRAAVQRKLGTSPAVSIAELGSSAVIAVRARSPQAARAAAVANTYAGSYVDYRRQKKTDGLLAAAQQIQARIDTLQLQINELGPPEPETGTTAPANPERDALITLRTTYRQQLEQLEVERALGSGGPEIALPASVPSSPLGPSVLHYGLIGLGIGLLVGIAGAWVLERLDDSVRTEEDLERSARGEPVLGVVPTLSGWKHHDETRLVSSTDPRSNAAEAYRTLRTSIQYSLDRPLRTLEVTSPGPSEGKTTTLVNLAVSLARAGQQVVVVSCDLRRPRLHEFFGLPNEVGFTSVLLGETPLSSALQDVPGQPRLRVLTSGPLQPNPSELLTSQRTTEVLASLSLQADIVLLDCPPVLPVTDATLVSTQVDGVLLVAMAGRTSRKATARAVELLRHVGAPLIGTVLNTAPSGEARGSEDYYSHAQAEKPDPARNRSDGSSNETPSGRPQPAPGL